MVYAIGTLAACLCAVVGVGIGYLIWGRPALMSAEERIGLQDEQLRLERQLHAKQDAETETKLNAINKKLTDDARRSAARWERVARAMRKQLLKDIARTLTT